MPLTYQGQSAVPTHTVPHDADPLPVQLVKVSEQSPREFVDDVAVHLVALDPRLLGCVDVESRSTPKVPRLILSRVAQTT